MDWIAKESSYLEQTIRRRKKVIQREKNEFPFFFLIIFVPFDWIIAEQQGHISSFWMLFFTDYFRTSLNTRVALACFFAISIEKNCYFASKNDSSSSVISYSITYLKLNCSWPLSLLFLSSIPSYVSFIRICYYSYCSLYCFKFGYLAVLTVLKFVSSFLAYTSAIKLTLNLKDNWRRRKAES